MYSDNSWKRIFANILELLVDSVSVILTDLENTRKLNSFYRTRNNGIKKGWFSNREDARNGRFNSESRKGRKKILKKSPRDRVRVEKVCEEFRNVSELHALQSVTCVVLLGEHAFKARRILLV